MTPFDASEVERIPDVEPIEKEIHQLTNIARKEHDRGTVEWSADLTYVARDHSRDMVKRGYLSHQNPEGEEPWDRVEKYGLNFVGVSENIAGSGLPGDEGPDEIADHIFTMWKTSEKGHWENILRDRHTHHGSGVYLDKAGVTATQLFAIKR